MSKVYVFRRTPVLTNNWLVYCVAVSLNEWGHCEGPLGCYSVSMQSSGHSWLRISLSKLWQWVTEQNIDDVLWRGSYCGTGCCTRPTGPAVLETLRPSMAVAHLQVLLPLPLNHIWGSGLYLGNPQTVAMRAEASAGADNNKCVMLQIATFCGRYFGQYNSVVDIWLTFG